MMQTTLVVGDWSGDGHEKTRSITFEHNLTREMLLAAYKAGSMTLGVTRTKAVWDPTYRVIEDALEEDVMEHVASDYEDATIPEDIGLAFCRHGILPNVWNEVESRWQTEDSEDLYTLEDGKFAVEGSDGFANLWMRIAKLGNSELEYKMVDLDTIDIGGYGIV